MKLFILQYAKQEDVDATHDEPMEDIDLEMLSSPQFAHVCTLDNLDDAIADLQHEVENELTELDFEVNDLTWVTGEWVDPIIGRRHKKICLLDDVDPVAQIVIQEVEAFTA